MEVVIQNQRPFAPGRDPDGTQEHVGRLAEAGATMLSVRLAHRSRSHHMEQLEAITVLVGSPA